MQNSIFFSQMRPKNKIPNFVLTSKVFNLHTKYLMSMAQIQRDDT